MPQESNPMGSQTVAEPIIETAIDQFMYLLESKKSMSFLDMTKALSWSSVNVERVAGVFERAGLLRIEYSSGFMSAPHLVFVQSLPRPTSSVTTRRLMDAYGFDADFVPAKVSIYFSNEEQRPEYEVRIPLLGPYTQVFLQSLRESIAKKIPAEMVEVSDVSKNQGLKNQFLDLAKGELSTYVSSIGNDVMEVLSGNLMHSMYGLGNLELLTADPLLEEIAVNSSHTPVTVYHRKYGWMKSNLNLTNEEEIQNFSSQIARKIGREINTLNPVLDAHLLSGDRVNATLFPISSFGNTITIRRFARNPWTIVDLIGTGHTMTTAMAAFLWQCIQYELSIIFAGGTASGKTSTLNALSAFFPAYHRVISIEDVREISLPSYLRWNWVALTTRNPNLEGSGEITMLDLMQTSLRMRPDRLVLGEIRRPREAEVLFEALQTGHSVYSTMHANNANQIVRRLVEPPFSVPSIEIESVDVLLTQFRDRRSNRRRTLEIVEIDSSAKDGRVDLNTLYHWRAREDDWLKVSPSTRVVQELNIHTGMTQKEVDEDLVEREKILNWMVENQLNGVEVVGSVMKSYYGNKSELLSAIDKKRVPLELFGPNGLGKN